MYQEDPNRCVLFPAVTRSLRSSIGPTESYYMHDDEGAREWAQYEITSSSTSVRDILDVFRRVLAREGWMLGEDYVLDKGSCDGDFVWKGQKPKKLVF